MDIHVTDADIVHGTRGSGRRCAIALALRRTLQDTPWCIEAVSGATVTLVNAESWDDIVFRRSPSAVSCQPLPRAARAFIHAFDQYEPVAPFSFALQMPWEMESEQAPVSEPEPELVEV